MKTFTNVSGNQNLLNPPGQNLEGFYVFRLVDLNGQGGDLNLGDPNTPFLDMGGNGGGGTQEKIAIVYLTMAQSVYFHAHALGPSITYQVFGARFVQDEL